MAQLLGYDKKFVYVVAGVVIGYLLFQAHGAWIGGLIGLVLSLKKFQKWMRSL